MATGSTSRGQASLPALAVALLILSSVTVVALVVADGVLAGADREPGERHAATSLAERLVSADGPIAVRENVIDGSALSTLDASTIEHRFPVVRDEAVRVNVGDQPIVSDPNARGGTTVRRIVVVSDTERRSITPRFGGPNAVTLPRRTDSVSLSLDPPNGTTVWSVRANDRVLLYDPSGLSGRYDLDLSRFETARLRFSGPGPLYRGNVTLEYPVERTSRAILTVTVDG